MADKLMRAQVTLHHGTGVAENDVVNTFHFDGDDFPGNDDAIYHDVVDDGLQAFYNALASYYSDVLTGGYTLKIFDMADPPTRVPEFTADRTIAGFGSTELNLPSEVAVVGSFAGAAVSGIPVATRRGRVYIGPLNASSMQQTGSRVRVNDNLLTDLRDALAVLGRLDIPAASQMSVRHSIYSPTWNLGRPATPKGSPAIDPHPLGEAFNDVTRGWVDDAFDTQRRRGEDAASRLTYTVAP